MPLRPPPPVLAILAGGASRRMGTDKAALPIAGVPLLARIAAAGSAAGLRVEVVGRTPPAWWTREDVVFHPDLRPTQGPLAGLVSALHAIPTAFIAVACDMPDLDAAALGWLAGRWREADAAHGLAVRQDGFLQPLFSVYAPACRAPAEALLAAGERSLQALLHGGGFAVVDLPAHLAGALADLDTPRDIEDRDRRLDA